MNGLKPDILIGFLGWFIINGLIWVLINFVIYHYRVLGFIFLIFPINIAVFVVLSFVRRQVALGILAAYALNLLITLGLGLSFWGVLGVPFTSLIYYD